MHKNKILSHRRPLRCNLCEILRDVMCKYQLGDDANEFWYNRDSV